MVLRDNLPIMSREQSDVRYHGNKGCRNRTRVAANVSVQTHVIVLIAELQVKRVQTFSRNSGWSTFDRSRYFRRCFGRHMALSIPGTDRIRWRDEMQAVCYAAQPVNLRFLNKRQGLGSYSRQCVDAASCGSVASQLSARVLITSNGVPKYCSPPLMLL